MYLLVYVGNVLLKLTRLYMHSQQQALRNLLKSLHQYEELSILKESSDGAFAFRNHVCQGFSPLGVQRTSWRKASYTSAVDLSSLNFRSQAQLLIRK